MSGKEAGCFDLGLANKVGQVLEILNDKYELDGYEIVDKFTSSKLFEHIVDWDVAVVSQSRYYIAGLFMEEFADMELKKTEFDFTESLFWYGYLIMRWCQIEDINGKYIADNFNTKSILQGFPVLHTLSIENAIAHIKIDDKKPVRDKNKESIGKEQV